MFSKSDKHDVKQYRIVCSECSEGIQCGTPLSVAKSTGNADALVRIWPRTGVERDPVNHLNFLERWRTRASALRGLSNGDPKIVDQCSASV